jgi:hypothetical protein
MNWKLIAVISILIVGCKQEKVEVEKSVTDRCDVIASAKPFITFENATCLVWTNQLDNGKFVTEIFYSNDEVIFTDSLSRIQIDYSKYFIDNKKVKYAVPESATRYQPMAKTCEPLFNQKGRRLIRAWGSVYVDSTSTLFDPAIYVKNASQDQGQSSQGQLGTSSYVLPTMQIERFEVIQ